MWTSPSTVVVGQIATAAFWNAQVRDNLSWLYGGSSGRVTTSAWSGGPPASPSDGDIWIATGVLGTTSRWQFQWSSTSSLWLFIGGPKVMNTTGAVYTNTVASSWQIPGTFASTVARAGTYQAQFSGRAANGTTTSPEIAVSMTVAGSIQGLAADAVVGPAGPGYASYLMGQTQLTITAGQTVDVAYFTSSIGGSSVQWSSRTMSLAPVSIT